ncbi:MAG: hypothetical protein AB1556_11765 [Bacillota bacterium]
MIIGANRTLLFFTAMLLAALAVGCRQPSAPGVTPSTENKVPAVEEATEKQIKVLKRQVELLEEALAARTHREAVETWAKGVKLRNGALQFAMFSPELKEQERLIYEKINWTTGVSSPWVEEFKITKEKQLADGQREYEVLFTMATSMGKERDQTAKVTVKRYDDFWYITAMEVD